MFYNYVYICIIGVVFGWLIGECMVVWFLEGILLGDIINKIVFGGYVVVG